jgi:hypothetical protein
MGSPRHWNVRRHILRSHGGLGEPTNEFGKTREEQQRLMNINLQFGHGNYYHNSQKSPSFPFKSSVGGGSTLKDRLPNYNNNNNNNKLRWDFMDDFIEPVKKTVEFKRDLAELIPSNQYYSYHYYPYAISHQDPQYPDFAIDDLEFIIGYQAYVCKDCLIFHLLTLYLDKHGKIIKMHHRCNSQRLQDVQGILDKEKELSELISRIPAKIKTVVNEWTGNQNYIYAVEVKKEELASNDLLTDLPVTGNQSWIARAIKDKQTTLTDEELEDFLERCGYSTFSYFSIHPSDNNEVPPVCYAMGIISPKIKYVADKLRSDNEDNYQELSMSNESVDNGIPAIEDPKDS